MMVLEFSGSFFSSPPSFCCWGVKQSLMFEQEVVALMKLSSAVAEPKWVRRD